MASSIDASTSGAGGVITTADNTGILQLKSGGTTIATISSTGLALNAGNITLPSTAAPAFSAYNNANQTLSTNTTTKIQFNTEVFDTNSNFDSTTNYRFTPTVAGYYLVSSQIACTSANSSEITIKLYKNGSDYTRLGRLAPTGQTVYFGNSALVSMNGSTDYLEMYVYTATGFTLEASYSLFSAFLARST
jgi:hypothetical protein